MVPLRVLGAGDDLSFGIEKPPGFFQDVGHPCLVPSDVDQLSFCFFNFLKQGQQLFVVRTLGAEHTHASFLHGFNSVPWRALLGSGVLGSLVPVRGWGGTCGRALDGLCCSSCGPLVGCELWAFPQRSWVLLGLVGGRLLLRFLVGACSFAFVEVHHVGRARAQDPWHRP